MPWKPLSASLKRHADRLNKSKRLMRPACFTHRRQELARQHKLAFFARLKFYLRASK